VSRAVSPATAQAYGVGAERAGCGQIPRGETTIYSKKAVSACRFDTCQPGEKSAEKPRTAIDMLAELAVLY